MDTENPKTAIEYIHSLGRFTGKPGLHRIKALCEALGNPQDRLKFVHLAGTNGKGSTACMIASALQADSAPDCIPRRIWCSFTSASAWTV